jgi:23S rRNA pseudouridine1911/1915/1917 synthase
MTILKANTHSAIITAAFDGQRLDKALTSLLATDVEALSRVRLQALMAAGHITLAGKPIDNASRKAKEGEVYTVTLPPPEAALPEAQNIALDIVFEDDDVIVINKPPGLVVHPAPGNRDKTLVNALLGYCGETLSGIGGVARPGIVHRLDKDTSGLIIVARNDHAHQTLSAQFADRTLSRTYHALVWGSTMIRAGSIDAPIGRHLRDRKKMAVSAKGKPALTHYKMIETYDVASLIECKLATGRTHQIRVHLAHLKHPVIGDPTYGRGRATGNKALPILKDFPRQALHAAEIQFKHPRSNKMMRFTVPMPEDMAKLLKALRKLK